MTEPDGDAQATFCATLVDEWCGRGVRAAVVAPGSRSTPMALALAERPELAVHIVHDERAAGFVALGLGLGGMPAVLLSTSGTAAANFHPAVVEAGLSDVPTAGRHEPTVHPSCATSGPRRPSTSRTCSGDPCDGSSTRAWPMPVAPTRGARWPRRAFDLAATGPVHLNLPFRDPLVGRPGPLPPGRPPQQTVAACGQRLVRGRRSTHAEG